MKIKLIEYTDGTWVVKFIDDRPRHRLSPIRPAQYLGGGANPPDVVNTKYHWPTRAHAVSACVAYWKRIDATPRPKSWNRFTVTSEGLVPINEQP